MIKKRILAMALIASFSVSLFTGCSSKGSTKGGEKANNESSETVGNMNKKGLPIVNDKMTFKMYTKKDVRQLDFNEMEFFKQLEQKTNVHIEWEFEDIAGGGQKKNLILASGQYPDAFFMGVTDRDVAKYSADGVFLKLEKLIDQYATNIKAAFNQKPVYKKAVTYVDGSIYSLGSAVEDEQQYIPDNLFIYKPWLDNLGLKVPTTIDEFYTVLKAFKEKDPNGNGKADEIPFSFRNGSTIQGIHSLFAAYGRADLVSSDKAPDVIDHFIQENGKVVFTADKQEYKNAINGLSKFFKEGLFDKEGFTQDAKQYFAKGKTKEVTLGSFMLWNAINMAGPDREKDYVAVPPFKGPDGKQVWTKYNGNNGNINNAAFAITSSCKNPEILVRWIDQFYDKKISAQAVYGPIGITLEESQSGVLKFKELPQGSVFDEVRYKNCPVWPATGLFADDLGKVVDMVPTGIVRTELIKKLYLPNATSQTLPQMSFTEDESKWNASEGNDIQNYVNQRRAKWLLDGGVDKEWDDYVAKLKQLKLDEHIKRMQTVYDRFGK